MARILIVEDDMVTRQLLTFQLKSSRHDIHMAPDGSVALSMLGDEHFDLVITDLNMPGLSGVALMEHARSKYNLRTLPFIMMTASIGFGEVMPAIADEVSAVLEKPVLVQDLLAAVEGALFKPHWLPPKHFH